MLAIALVNKEIRLVQSNLQVTDPRVVHVLFVEVSESSFSLPLWFLCHPIYDDPDT